MDSLRPAFTFSVGRREWLRQSGIVAGGFALCSSRAIAASDGGISRTAESIHQEVGISAEGVRPMAVESFWRGC